VSNNTTIAARSTTSQVVCYPKTRMLPEDPQEARVAVNLSKKGYFLVNFVLYFGGADVIQDYHTKCSEVHPLPHQRV